MTGSRAAHNRDAQDPLRCGQRTASSTNTAADQRAGAGITAGRGTHGRTGTGADGAARQSAGERRMAASR